MILAITSLQCYKHIFQTTTPNSSSISRSNYLSITQFHIYRLKSYLSVNYQIHSIPFWSIIDDLDNMIEQYNHSFHQWQHKLIIKSSNNISTISSPIVLVPVHQYHQQLCQNANIPNPINDIKTLKWINRDKYQMVLPTSSS